MSITGSLRSVAGSLACYSFLAMGCSAEIIDRIAVSVGTQVITEAQIDDQIRVTAFLNGEVPVFTGEQKRKAADRLVELALIQREMDLTHYPLPESEEIMPVLRQVKKRFKSEAEFKGGLVTAQLGEEDLKKQLLTQLTTLRFIEYRFRPEVQITEAAITEYYDKQVAEWHKSNSKPAPSREESRAEIEKILMAAGADQALDRWLGEVRTQTDIVYRNEVFK